MRFARMNSTIGGRTRGIALVGLAVLLAAATTGEGVARVHGGGLLPFSGQLAYSSTRNGSADIYVIGPSGSETPIGASPAFDGFPAWSPGGTTFAFESNRDGDAEIFVMGADGGRQTQLTETDAQDSIPAWSPDGTKIVFQTTRDGNSEIYVMGADGGNPVRLTMNSVFDGFPAWSPDGTQILFSRVSSSAFHIWVMGADGQDERKLTEGAVTDLAPDWSPDGSRIAFTRGDANGDFHLWTMELNGEGQERITIGRVTDVAPAWSPDGTRLAFYSDRDGNSEIYVIDPDGSDLARVTDNPAVEEMPDWDPSVDTDLDGCSDSQELGSIAALGGRRDLQSFWDFFDTPDTAGTRDKVITAGDISRAVQRFGFFGNPDIDPLSLPEPPNVYHTAFDRTPAEGGDPWDLAGPNGSVAAQDIALIVMQFGHTCVLSA